MNKYGIKLLLTGIILSLIVACADRQVSKSQGDINSSKNDHLILSTLYHQQAAENAALAYQTYNVAQMLLDKDLKISLLHKKRAVIVDIDETVLDNSPYQAKCIQEGINYPEGWIEWCNKAKAKAIPGSKDFLSYAAEKGVEVYYITNRKEEVREATKKNLKELGFPFVEDDHLIMRTSTSSKQERREKVEDDHRVVMLIGDNLGDFAEVFEKGSVENRFALTDSLKNEFGTHFLILPNAMYGDWEGAIYDHNYGLPEVEKSKIRNEKLEGY